MSATVSTWVILAVIIFGSAIGSFIGCLIYVKIYKWDKIKVHTKLEVSKDAVQQMFSLREKVNSKK